jgi:hypothetical protein
MDSRIKTVLEYAVMAPSGDNCQPWKFTVDGLNVDLFNNPDQDRSLYNLKQRASLIAHGALLENIRLAAPSVGLQSQAALLPDPANQKQIASIRFTECKTEQTAHFKAIPQRQTNREKYQPVKISDSQVRQWQSLPDGPGQKITVAHQPSQINHLAKRLSLNDRLVFEIPALHRFLFEQLRWTDEEAQRTGDGLDIKTLGLNAMDRVSFRLLKHWGLVAACNRAGFTSIVQMKARQLIKSSSAVAIVTIPGAQALDYIEGGTLWQRLLLQLSSEGLTAQPIAGLACLMQGAQEGLLGDAVTEIQRACLLNTRKELLTYVGGNDSNVILAMFRIGQGPAVTRALRRPLRSFL